MITLETKDRSYVCYSSNIPRIGEKISWAEDYRKLNGRVTDVRYELGENFVVDYISIYVEEVE
jgi:hypothetical protein